MAGRTSSGPLPGISATAHPRLFRASEAFAPPILRGRYNWRSVCDSRVYMKILIVYAHPEPKSFNGAMKNHAVEVLTGAGHEVVVSDLYALGFEPRGGPVD